MKDIYSDFDVEFNLNKKTGDINIKRNMESVKQSIWCLLQTNFYERKWHPEIGSYFPKIMFRQAHPALLHVMEDQIEELLQSHEPRIQVGGVRVYFKNQSDEEKGALTIEISFSTLELGSVTTVFHMERTR